VIRLSRRCNIAESCSKAPPKNDKKYRSEREKYFNNENLKKYFNNENLKTN